MGSRLPGRPGAQAGNMEPQALPAVKRVQLALRSTHVTAAYDSHDGTELRAAPAVQGQRPTHRVAPAALPSDRLQSATTSFPIGAYIRRYSMRRSDDNH